MLDTFRRLNHFFAALDAAMLDVRTAIEGPPMFVLPPLPGWLTAAHVALGAPHVQVA